MFLTFLFWFFSALLLGAALMVVVSQHPVRSVLFLVLCFFAASALWLLMSAEFLALVLILVYVGAVMTLFLFVVMTINVDFASLKQPFLRYYVPLGLLLTAMLTALLIYVISPAHSMAATSLTQNLNASMVSTANATSNVMQLGGVLYTDYVYPFEIAAVILLVAIIAAISLALSEPYQRKQQSVYAQVTVKRHERIRIVKMSSVNKEK